MAVAVAVAVAVADAVGVGVEFSPGVAKDFHRVQWGDGTVVATCQPDAGGTIGIGGEVAPRSRECRAKRPAIANRIIDVHLVGN